MFTLHALLATALYLVDLLLLVPKYTKSKYDHTPRKKRLVWKGFCIGVPFLVLTLYSVFRAAVGEATLINWLLVAAMFFCGAGDIILEIRFIKGGFLFFTGHILYVITLFILQDGVSVIAIAVYVVLAGLGTYLTCTKLSEKYRFLLIGYNLAISGSFALSIPLILTGEPAFVLVGTGACFLAVSDWILARNRTYGSTYGWYLLSLLFYFGGQVLISTYPFLQ